MASKVALMVAGLLLLGGGVAAATYASTNETGLAGALGPLGKHLGWGKGPCGPDAEERAEALKEKHPEKADKIDERRAKHAEKCDRRESRDRPHPPPFAQDGASVSGKFAAFTIVDGGLADYVSKGPWADAAVFDGIAIEGLAADGRVVGGTYRAGDEENGVGLVAFNAPNAGLFVLSRDGTTVTYDLADGVVAEYGEDGVVKLSRDGKTATLKARNGTLAIDGDVVTATLAAKGAVGFSIDGYPRMLHAEKHAIREHLRE